MFKILVAMKLIVWVVLGLGVRSAAMEQVKFRDILVASLLFVVLFITGLLFLIRLIVS